MKKAGDLTPAFFMIKGGEVMIRKLSILFLVWGS
ncbi:hypothetical protein SAMN05216353_102183 [Halobacillus alkaliphilus]|uniref:Uncharacterized protein n=1 Tax=Halobacillus alkaliphilus TaxID=396056 RepID=A0A1I2JUJ3_9BACI|nr:hypothetical protein SAMN05216353_102183 [Halobacillus alkaliphilus]